MNKHKHNSQRHNNKQNKKKVFPKPQQAKPSAHTGIFSTAKPVATHKQERLIKKDQLKQDDKLNRLIIQ